MAFVLFCELPSFYAVLPEGTAKHIPFYASDTIYRNIQQCTIVDFWGNSCKTNNPVWNNSLEIIILEIVVKKKFVLILQNFLMQIKEIILNQMWFLMYS